MKKLLACLSSLVIVGSSTLSLVACEQYVAPVIDRGYFKGFSLNLHTSLTNSWNHIEYQYKINSLNKDDGIQIKVSEDYIFNENHQFPLIDDLNAYAEEKGETSIPNNLKNTFLSTIFINNERNSNYSWEVKQIKHFLQKNIYSGPIIGADTYVKHFKRNYIFIRSMDNNSWHKSWEVDKKRDDYTHSFYYSALFGTFRVLLSIVRTEYDVYFSNESDKLLGIKQSSYDSLKFDQGSVPTMWYHNVGLGANIYPKN